MWLDSQYVLCVMIPATLLMTIVTIYVRSAYNRWSRVANRAGLTGYEAAERLLAAGGLYGVRIQGIDGQLTDHYDPRQKVLRLSLPVIRTPSIASVAVAAHELGHAMQDKEEYLPLRFRSALVPMVNIGSYLGWVLILLGILLASMEIAFGVNLAWMGVAAFSGGVLFALATLPVEFNASARARRLLRETGIITSAEEMRGVNAVLNAAALTYLAALVTALLQLLYYIGLVGRLSGRRR